MTVRELIEKLSTLNPDARVYLEVHAMEGRYELTDRDINADGPEEVEITA